jgi:hypothetical protein
MTGKEIAQILNDIVIGMKMAVRELRCYCGQ